MLLAALFMPLAAVFYFSKCQRNRCGPHYVLQMDSVQLYPVDHPTGSAGDVVYHADV